MSFSYHHINGLLVTLNGLNLVLPDMTIFALQKHVRELEAYYG